VRKRALQISFNSNLLQIITLTVLVALIRSRPLKTQSFLVDWDSFGYSLVLLVPQYLLTTWVPGLSYHLGIADSPFFAYTVSMAFFFHGLEYASAFNFMFQASQDLNNAVNTLNNGSCPENNITVIFWLSFTFSLIKVLYSVSVYYTVMKLCFINFDQVTLPEFKQYLFNEHNAGTLLSPHNLVLQCSPTLARYVWDIKLRESWDKIKLPEDFEKDLIVQYDLRYRWCCCRCNFIFHIVTTILITILFLSQLIVTTLLYASYNSLLQDIC